MANGESSFPPNPTKEFLLNKLSKTELQEYCEYLSLSDIWDNKDSLVKMIIEVIQKQGLADKNEKTELLRTALQTMQEQDSGVLNLLLKMVSTTENLAGLVTTTPSQDDIETSPSPQPVTSIIAPSVEDVHDRVGIR